MCFEYLIPPRRWLRLEDDGAEREKHVHGSATRGSIVQLFLSYISRLRLKALLLSRRRRRDSTVNGLPLPPSPLYVPFEEHFSNSFFLSNKPWYFDTGFFSPAGTTVYKFVCVLFFIFYYASSLTTSDEDDEDFKKKVTFFLTPARTVRWRWRIYREFV